jgi:hypothetical protein
MRWSSALASAALALATVAALVIVSGRLRLDPNVGSLLPDQGDAVALRRYVRAFGGGDLGAVMVRGADPELNRRLCGEIAAALRSRPSIEQAVDRLESSQHLSPWLVWRHASTPVRARLAAALTPDGMRARLRETARCWRCRAAVRSPRCWRAIRSGSRRSRSKARRPGAGSARNRTGALRPTVGARASCS